MIQDVWETLRSPVGIACLVAAALVVAAVRWGSLSGKVRRAKRISATEFSDQWILQNKSKGSVGYKYLRQSGCYVILIYRNRLTSVLRHHEDVYVGQSENIYWRVNNHFHAKGNGRVYGSIMAGKLVYVKFFPCKKKAMNTLERDLIRYFHADSSFNQTAGGGKIRRTNR